MSARKNLKVALRTLCAAGWQMDPHRNGHGHITLRHPCGARITASSTPRDADTHKITLASARRALAACAGKEKPAFEGGRKG